MVPFARRWGNALACVKISPFGDNNVAAKQVLRRQFRESTFIYGTVGPNALHYGGGRRGNPAARAATHWIRRTQGGQHGHHIALRVFNLYDPGPRTRQLIQGGHQMMDMYYGMNNGLYRLRKTNIAEFVHYAMHFHVRNVDFDPDQSGRDAYFAAFPGASEGWFNDGRAHAIYGQTATKEMSKIIREGIRAFGGKLIFEGKSVFGAGVFDPNAYQGDTDLEAQDLLGYFRNARSAQVPYGNGILEFQWGGRPTAPTRAHFLTNWNHSDTWKTHHPVNRVNQDNPEHAFRDYIARLMGPHHGLRPIWDHLPNWPAGLETGGDNGTRGMQIAIARLVNLLFEPTPVRAGTYQRPPGWRSDPQNRW